MKKKLMYIIPVILIIIIIVIIVITKNNKDDKLIYITGNYDKLMENDNYVINNYDDYYTIFKNDELKPDDFDNHNYVVISFTYDTCHEDNIRISNYQLNGNILDVTIKYHAKCGVCAPKYMYYLLKVDKSLNDVNINYQYEADNEVECDPGIEYKPMIYLYPKKDTHITITFDKPYLLKTTYPKYRDKWEVLAKPNGDLYDNNNHYYYGLYWEGYTNIKTDFSDGFVVSKEELIPFLEEKLTILGLNEREKNEFIVYWLPILEESEYNIIRFEDSTIINQEMPITISPKPDTLIRILMEFKPVNQKIAIKEQELTKTNRNGYTVVEWGGTIYK